MSAADCSPVCRTERALTVGVLQNAMCSVGLELDRGNGSAFCFLMPVRSGNGTTYLPINRPNLADRQLRVNPIGRRLVSNAFFLPLVSLRRTCSVFTRAFDCLVILAFRTADVELFLEFLAFDIAVGTLTLIAAVAIIRGRSNAAIENR